MGVKLGDGLWQAGAVSVPLQRVVIVGGSLAAMRAAETLRQIGFDGSLVMVSAEDHLPYDRPPLSKQVLDGRWEPERTALRRPEVLEELAIDWHLGVAASGLDLGSRRLSLSTDEVLDFDGLIIATGASTRTLPASVTEHLSDAGPAVVELRTLDDAVALRDLIAPGDRRVVVIGAGFIGLEVAATARSLGNHTVVIEAAPAPLIRGLGAEMGSAIAAVHTDAGTEIRCGEQVLSIDDRGVTVQVGHTAEVIGADVVVVGIGVQPNTRWLESSGLSLDDGVVCDAFLQAGAPLVYAAGDVVRWPNGLFDETMRIEHWSNAAEQGALAARNLAAEAGLVDDEREEYAAVPFFWSDQYDHRIQFLGRADGVDGGVDGRVDGGVRVVIGSVDERSFVALYGSAGRLRGVLGLNRPRQTMPYRRLLEDRASLDDALAFAAEQVTAEAAAAAQRAEQADEAAQQQQ